MSPKVQSLQPEGASVVSASVSAVVDCAGARRGVLFSCQHVALLSDAEGGLKRPGDREGIEREGFTSGQGWEGARMGSEIAMEDAAGAMAFEEQQEEAVPQGVVLVVLDVNKEFCTQGLNWALGHVTRKGDALRLVGVLSHVRNPSKSLLLSSMLLLDRFFVE